MGIAGGILTDHALRNTLSGYQVYGGEEFIFDREAGKLTVVATNGTGDEMIEERIEFRVLFDDNGLPLCPELIHKYGPYGNHKHQAFIFHKTGN